jgi:multicomponent Na+:H+ antiporter subunit G
MAQIMSMTLFLTGAAFMLVAAIGVVRMPDLLMRLHCSTKSATLGVSCVMLGAALHFSEVAIWARALAAIAFLFATAPVAAHVLGRAAYVSGAPLWLGTLSDELRGCYAQETHRLTSPPEVLESEAGQGTVPG